MIFTHTSSNHPNFQQINTRHLTGLDIQVRTYKHLPTGLMHYHLSCDNSENGFMIGFATQPMTSRGEAHILEHVVLCGSQKYPVRDPFFSMIKRSLQTFMNAMTASDWTVYPFATQNRKDFFNLMDVYLDAVLFPNIHPLDFAQEGIRLELDEADNLHYHGIVFNEMKGAMSGEIDQLYYALMPHLFDSTTYHYNSGGDPAEIPKLNHHDLVAFHQKYYHPSNAVMMSFGNIDVNDIHAHTQGYLDKFDNKTRPSQSTRFFVPNERRHTAPISIHDTYSSDKDGDKMTHQVIAWLLPAITDPKQQLAMRLMEGVLIEHSGLPLRQYLETTPLGQAASPLLGLDDSHHEMVFYAGLRGSEIAHSDTFEREILSLLNDVASRPIDPDTIETILHQMELDKRHIGGDSMPYGLSLMLEGFSSAIHGADPVDIWDIDEHLLWLKNQLGDPMWLPNLIKTHLVDNPHRVQLTLSPDSQKAAKLAAAEQATLDELSKTLDEPAKAAIRQQTADLAARQAMSDDVEILPKVGLQDIPSQVAFVHGQTLNLNADHLSYPLYQYTIGTNGLYYYQLVMDLDNDALIKHPLMPIYLAVLSELGTDKFDARSFQAHQARHGSGVTARISQRSQLGNTDKLSSYFILATRALSDKPTAINVVHEVLNETIFSETDRLKELLTQRQMSWQARLSGAGHAYAMQTASAVMSTSSALEYAYSGLPALQALKAFLTKANDDSTAWQELGSALLALHKKIQTLPKSVILICEDSHQASLQAVITKALAADSKPTAHQDISLSAYRTLDDFTKLHSLLDTLIATSPNKGSDTAWLIATNVYHNAAVYPAVPSTHPDAAALMVLAPYLKNGYLHSAIREKGGAYGGGASFDGNTASFRFFSYRDPNCQATFEHFDKSIDWLLNNNHDSHQLEEAILGLIASMDKPGSPAGDAVKSCLNERHGRSHAYYEQLRSRLLAVTLDDLQRVARTYLKDAHSIKATLAPMDSQTVLTPLGFVVHKLS